MSVKYQITTPVGIDKQIQKLQLMFFDRLWNSPLVYDSYGRSYQVDEDGENAEVAAFTGGNDYEKLKGNDNVDALSFFVANSGVEIGVGLYQSTVQIYFFVNLATCYDSITNRADENAHREVLNILRLHPYGFKPLGITWGGNISNFKITDNMQPYHVFMISAELNYNSILNSC